MSEMDGIGLSRPRAKFNCNRDGQRNCCGAEIAGYLPHACARVATRAADCRRLHYLAPTSQHTSPQPLPHRTSQQIDTWCPPLGRTCFGRLCGPVDRRARVLGDGVLACVDEATATANRPRRQTGTHASPYSKCRWICGGGPYGFADGVNLAVCGRICIPSSHGQ
jgi:hypothetical protein